MSSVNELNLFYENLTRCRNARDLFGDLPKDHKEAEAQLGKIRKSLFKLCHPDLFQSDGKKVLYVATEAANMLGAFYDEALGDIQTNQYWKKRIGQKKSSVGTIINSPRREYHVYQKIATGDVADVFLADYAENGSTYDVVFKVACDSDDNSLITNEQIALSKIRHKSIPSLVEKFKTTEGKNVSVLSYIEGCDLYALRENPLYKNGVPIEHMCWILERQLSVLGFVHSNMHIHGNIEPGNIVMRPQDHNAFLIDYTFSIGNPGQDDYIKCFTPGFSAPETEDKLNPLPTADLYALGKCMVYLIGGDVNKGVIPNHVNSRIAQFLESLIDPDFQARARDAWEAHQKLVDLRTEVYGKERFKTFEV